MTTDIDFPWTEEFRPKNVADVLGNDNLIQKIQEYVNNKSIPNLLFVGSAGTGKTSIAKILANNICGTGNYLFINASDQNNIDTIRNEVKNYCSVAGFNENIKIVILDEFDGMGLMAQKSLRSVMEEYAKTTRFILCANYENKILNPIQSRCQKFEFVGANKTNIAKKCVEILLKKKIKPKTTKEEMVEGIKLIINENFPDIRLIINNLQKSCINGEFVYNVENNKESNKEKLLEYIKTGKLKTIREEILILTIDYQILYDTIYMNVKELTNNPDKIGAIILTISEYMYRHSTHINPEINFMACLIEVRSILKDT